MNAFELNKIAGAVLGVALMVMSVNLLAGLVMSPEKPAIPGYALPSGDAPAATQVAAAPADTPIEERLKTADAARGQRAVSACAACHTFERGAANRVGPNLWNTVDQTKGHAETFGYSAALRERKGKGEKWDAASLDAFLKNPRGYMPGTSMSFAGISRADQRADIIAYMQSLR
jgi:cytochrome c